MITMKNLTEILEKADFKRLCDVVYDCGIFARDKQKNIGRSYKNDGTVVTEIDLKISDIILKTIKELFPFANVLSEECTTPFDDQKDWTFVLDPIDGTDSYSQGMTGWAIALGILKHREPVGAIVFAPRFGVGEPELFITLYPNEKPLLNQQPLTLVGQKDEVTMIAMESACYRSLNFAKFTGTIRIFGSEILHLLAPVIFPHIQASVHERCYAWDACAAHAVINSVGMKVEYINGEPFIYSDDMLKHRKPYPLQIVAGTQKGCKFLAQTLFTV